ncbi:MAG: hypothetical protein GEU28_03315 [Dehalococcoidia bacterium]|nr:hypothetical protein [Dehalococcoidia bacterium]
MIGRVGIAYANSGDTRAVVPAFEDAVRQTGREAWSATVWDDGLDGRMTGTDLLICIGGDGTVLRGARTAAVHDAPILGVNMGRLGFLAELSPREALANLPAILDGTLGRIEERAMLRAELLSPVIGTPPTPGEGPYHAVNDIILGRAGIGRPTYIQATVNGARLASYRADAVVISTPTGSTAYNMSAGGPILAPDLKAFAVTPVAPHLSLGRAIVLPGDASLELRVATDHRAVLNVDGQGELGLVSGGGVRVTVSEHAARLVRIAGPNEFYEHLSTRLNSLTARTLQLLLEDSSH